MTIYKGNILTVNAESDTFEYLVEDAGKIVFVGNDLPELYRDCQVIDLGNRALIPAFVDTHQHFASFSTFNAGLNVMDAKSNAEIMERVETFQKSRKDKLLIAFGASPYSVEEKRLVNRAELDRACPDKMIMMVKYDGHACIVNTPLLKKLEKKIQSLRGYHPDTGELFRMCYPESEVPNKIPMPRPVDYYFKDWKGPVRPEFKENLDMSQFTGNQKWQMWCLEQFLNMNQL